MLYDREAPFELRIQDPNSGPQEVGTLEAIRVKILTLVSNIKFDKITHNIDIIGGLRSDSKR